MGYLTPTGDITKLRQEDRLMLDLDDPLWRNLGHAHGTAASYPSLLRQLLADAQNDADLDDDLMESICDICHQYSTYDSTIAAVPHLIFIASEASIESSIRKFLVSLLSVAIAGIILDKTSATRELVAHFDASLKRANLLALESLASATAREDRCAAFALLNAASADPEFAGALTGFLRNSLQCSSCYQFLRPINLLNPFDGGKKT